MECLFTENRYAVLHISPNDELYHGCCEVATTPFSRFFAARSDLSASRPLRLSPSIPPPSSSPKQLLHSIPLFNRPVTSYRETSLDSRNRNHFLPIRLTYSCIESNSTMGGPSPVPSVVSIPIVTVTGTDGDGDRVLFDSRYIGYIPTTGRCVWRVSTTDGASQRFRPAAEPENDPFAHDETFSSASRGECRIKECQYCALCEKYNIAPHSLQEKLNSHGGGTNAWDPYFHWIMNEQILILYPGSPSKGAINWGVCWIQDCRCKNHGNTPSDKKMAATTSDYSQLPNHVEYPKLLFPFRACRRHNLEKNVIKSKRSHPCNHCKAMLRRLQGDKTRGDGAPRKIYRQMEFMHNDNLYRRIAYALSPLATVPNDFPKKEDWDNCDDLFFNLSESDMPAPPAPEPTPAPPASSSSSNHRHRSLSVDEQHQFEQVMMTHNREWGYAVQTPTQRRVKLSCWARFKVWLPWYVRHRRACSRCQLFGDACRCHLEPR